MSLYVFIYFNMNSILIKCLLFVYLCLQLVCGQVLQNQTNLTASSGAFFSPREDGTNHSSVPVDRVPAVVALAGDNMTDISGTRQAFTGLIPIHMLPSNQIVDYFPWEVEIGLETCPYVGMLVRARRGASGNSSAETERLQDLWNYPSPHCSVECECMPTGDYQCRSVCPVPPADMDFCVPVEVPGQCCHKYVCDDDLDAAFPNLQFPEPQNTTVLMCLPGTILPDSVCHHTFPKAFSGHLGPKGICLDFDDIRCVWLEDNEIPVAATVVTGRTAKELTATVRRGRRTGKQTIFFQTTVNGTVFSTTVPLKTLRKRLDFGTTV